jgi:hypothetical protein
MIAKLGKIKRMLKKTGNLLALNRGLGAFENQQKQRVEGNCT